MNEIDAEADMFSSMEGEMISNIKRPSFLSLSSDDSLDEKVGNESTVRPPSSSSSSSYFKTSTPFKSRDVVDNTICEKSDDGLEDYDFKIPSAAVTGAGVDEVGAGYHFPSSRSGKRYSLSSFNEAARLYSSIMNKSSSMQDVSSLASSASAFCPLRRDSSCMFSTETLQSNSIATSKSKDSGFQRSTSCTSLTTNASKKYEHVQSKVKQYIQTIKQAEALRKMQKQLQLQKATTSSMTSADSAAPSQSGSPNVSPVSKRDLLQKVKALEEELKERDCVIEQLEKNQSELRLKYAAAENQIDDLRIRASVHEDPLKNYMSDEKVAELLTSNAKIGASMRKYPENVVTKQLMRAMNRDDVVSSPTIGVGAAGRDLRPVTKFGSTSSRIMDEFPVLKSSGAMAAADGGILKSSSCKYIKDGGERYELSKSASNIDRSSVRFADVDMMELPYERNSFAKVQHWQRSLANLNKHHHDVDEKDDETGGKGDALRTRCSSKGVLSMRHDVGVGCWVGVGQTDDSADENRRKTRRYQKNKDADKRRYQLRRSYPVGCRCEKYKCKSKEDVNATSPPSIWAQEQLRRVSPPRQRQLVPLRGKLVRSVSFASCEDSLTSSLYDEGASSSDDSAIFWATNGAAKHESYKEYKQRRLQQRFEKSAQRERSLNWMPVSATSAASELKKTKSANSLLGLRGPVGGGVSYVAEAPAQRSKRLLDSVTNSSCEYSCSSDRKPQQQYSSSKVHQQQHSSLYSHDREPSHPHQHHHHNKTKYRKLDDCTKVASTVAGCNALIKCHSARACRSANTSSYYEDSTCVQHSKSFDPSARRHDKESGHRLSKKDCSCLTALENLKIHDHNAFLKFAEHVHKCSPPKIKEKEPSVVYKRYSLQK